ncbi:cytochrome P450 [Cynara cardunculus var. scolymus]|uniref:Cytochrome P450 n=2 Tax=Cynara cardunculus var. scolymus TaxID=59895 RepID=A0A118JYQ9_CYNCS|nr:cytochrome P450 [Cynara cardunculus var. scolymus]
MVVASTAEAAGEILKTHDAALCNRPKLNLPHVLTYGSKDLVFSSYGEYWRQIKSIAVLHLLSNRRVQSFRRVREDETRVMIDMIRESRGSLVDLSDLSLTLTNNVVCRATLGRTYPEFEFKHLLKRLSFLIGVYSIGNYIPWLSWVDWLNGLQRSAHEVAKEFDYFIEGVIGEHINKKKGLDIDAESDISLDFVDILLDVQSKTATSLTTQSVKALILDMFAGGTDTTPPSIEWAMSELIKHPRMMKKLQQEAREVAQGRSMINEEDLEKMQYLKAVIKETLRLHPPAVLLLPREAIKDVKLMGYDVKAGTQVVVNTWAVGRDPSVWEEANKFRPERFLNSDIDYKGLHFELLPFGGGRRGCPGLQFAVAIIELSLANLVYKFDFQLPDEKRGEELDMSETTGTVVHRKSPLLVMATPRF